MSIISLLLAINPKSLYRLSVSTFSIVTSVNEFSVALVSSGCNVLYNASRYFLSLKRSKNTLFFAVRFAFTSCIDIACVVSSCTLSPQSLRNRAENRILGFYCPYLIIQKTALIYNKIYMKFFLCAIAQIKTHIILKL